jgi:methyl-accepting chemotaxis protein
MPSTYARPDRQVRSALEANRSRIYVFRPNALDGKDELFADQANLAATTRALLGYWSCRGMTKAN